MTGRPGLALGETGDIWVRPNGRGGFSARTRVRDRDGRVREVTATAKTKDGARRALRQRLESRTPEQAHGVSASMSIAQLADYWLEHRQRTGLVRGRGPVKPQTLAAYRDALRLLVVPAMGSVRVGEATVGLLETILADLDESGQSTYQARSVLSQMLGLAVRHEALPTNPMLLVAYPPREAREVEALDVSQVEALRRLVLPEALRRPGKRGPNGDLRDVVDGLLGTGCRIGELLALQWKHLSLDGDQPTALISGTLVEPRQRYVATLHRQESTKTKAVRTLILPAPLVDSLLDRRNRSAHDGPEDPVFASRTGAWLWPNNLRTRLRAAVDGHDELAGITPHTLRRTVGTLVAHARGLDAARDQLGHSDPSITFRSYVAARPVAPDLRDVLEPLLAPLEQQS